MTPRVKIAGLVLEIPGRTLLDDVSVSFHAGECVAVMGPSGSGKTSLLNCIAGISLPRAGSIHVEDVEVTALDESARAGHRLRAIGMVFQFGELLPELSVVENAALPLRFAGEHPARARARALAMLERLGVADKAERHPDVLSGGETQRVGIARALASSPSLILADEPTGMLDEANAAGVTALLISLSREIGATIVIATHDPTVASAADRVLRLREGELMEVSAPEVVLERSVPA